MFVFSVSMILSFDIMLIFIVQCINVLIFNSSELVIILWDLQELLWPSDEPGAVRTERQWTAGGDSIRSPALGHTTGRGRSFFNSCWCCLASYQLKSEINQTTVLFSRIVQSASYFIRHQSVVVVCLLWGFCVLRSYLPFVHACETSPPSQVSVVVGDDLTSASRECLWTFSPFCTAGASCCRTPRLLVNARVRRANLPQPADNTTPSTQNTSRILNWYLSECEWSEFTCGCRRRLLVEVWALLTDHALV